MKKYIIILSAFIACLNLHSATIYWGGDGVVRFGQYSVGSTGMGYLVYLGEGATDWSGVDISTLISGSSSSIVANVPSGAGMMPGESSSTTFTTAWNNNNSTYGFIILYNGKPSDDIENSTWYYLSDVFLVSTTSPYYTLGTDSYAWKHQINSTGSGNNTISDITGQGWTKYIPVPEPATAGLALAGLALLFRRKRK